MKVYGVMLRLWVFEQEFDDAARSERLSAATRKLILTTSSTHTSPPAHVSGDGIYTAFQPGGARQARRIATCSVRATARLLQVRRREASLMTAARAGEGAGRGSRVARATAGAPIRLKADAIDAKEHARQAKMMA